MSQFIERIEEMRLSRQDEAEIATLLVRAFRGGFDGRSYHKQRHHLRLVWREEGRILGHMALCMRDVRMGKVLVPIIGLAEVSTDPQSQGRGIASALMSAAIEEARSSLAAFFVLFGDKSLYAAAGFQRHANRLRIVKMDDAVTHEVTTILDDGLMVLPLGDLEWDDTVEVDLLGHLF